MVLTISSSVWVTLMDAFVMPKQRPPHNLLITTTLHSPTTSNDYDSSYKTKLHAGARQRQGNTSSKKNKNYMTSSNNKSNKKRGIRSAGKSSTSAKASGPASRSGQSNQPKEQHSAPPWQVVSQKDMKKNIAAEQARRTLAQDKGEHMTPQQIEMTRSEMQRSTAFLSGADKALLGWKPFSLSQSNHRVEFKGAFLDKQLPPRLGAPEVAFIGRSNVGKSSLLNRLIGPTTSTDVARVGKTPGATASVNLYGIYETARSSSISSKKDKDNDKAVMGLVDLPGFGYAKLAKETQRSVQDTAEHYLAQRDELALGVLLVDIRRVPTVDDKRVLAALFDMGLGIVVVATKVDKLSSSHKVEQALQLINVELGLPEGQPLCISSVTGQGVKDLWRIILEACEGHVEEMRGKIEGGTMDEFDGSSFEDIKAAAKARGEEFDDDYAYSQGYDWIQGSVMYDDDEDRNGVMLGIDDNDDYRWHDNSEANFGSNGDTKPLVEEKLSIQTLRRRAKDMERRGEI